MRWMSISYKKLFFLTLIFMIFFRYADELGGWDNGFKQI